MAGNIWVANTTAESLLASSSEKCIIRLIAPTSFGVKIKEWGVFFDGVTATAEPVVVQIATVDTSYGEYTAHVPARRAGRGLVAQSVVQTLNTSSQPTKFTIMATREIHPQSGYQEKFSYGDEILVMGQTTASGQANSGGAIGLFVNSPTSVNVLGEIVFEE